MKDRASTTQRIFGFDLLRTVVFLAIIIFHSSWVLLAYDPNPRPDLEPNLLMNVLFYYAQMLTLGGHVILCLTSLLFGMRARAFWHHWRTWLGLLLAWVVFALLLWLREGGDFHLAWEVYPLLALGWSTSYVLIFRGRTSALLTLACSLLLLTQAWWDWEFFAHLPPYAQEVLVGRCPEDYADWPVLPWLGLVWASVACGYLLRTAQDLSLRRWELPLWGGVVVGWALNYQGDYYVALGDAFACELFRRPVLIRWTQLGLLALCLRVSVMPQVQAQLGRCAVVRWISSLASNQRFYAAYFVHYVLIFIFFVVQKYFELYGVQWFNTLAYGGMPIFTEIATRLVGKKKVRP
jgi:hypothetical protein